MGSHGPCDHDVSDQRTRFAALVSGGAVSENTGRQVILIDWPFPGKLIMGMTGTVISEHPRYVMVQWDNLSKPMAMRYEEIKIVG